MEYESLEERGIRRLCGPPAPKHLRGTLYEQMIDDFELRIDTIVRRSIEDREDGL